MTETTGEKIRHLEDMRQHLKSGGGEKRIQKQHTAGKLTARERIDILFDSDSFCELNLFAHHRPTESGMNREEYPADGVITGFGRVNGQTVYAYAQDFTVGGGSAGEVHEKKIATILEMAGKTGSPIVGINDSGGARIQEGALSLVGYGDIFYRNTQLSGKVPQIAIIAGPCAGGAAYSPALMDFVIMIKGISRMFVTGPENIKNLTGEEITSEELGGAQVHAYKSGVCHLLAEDEPHAFRLLKKLLSYLPANSSQTPPHNLTEDPDFKPCARLDSIIPDGDAYAPFDMREVITSIADEDTFFEIQEKFAGNMITGFARINGYCVGICANQPLVKQGFMDRDSAGKMTRFVNFCNSFNIPLINFIDVPGFIPGVAEEHGGILLQGAKVLFALSTATIPRISVITRKAYGGTFLAMGTRAMGFDRVMAWPTAEISVLDARTAVRILYRDEIKNAENPEEKTVELIEKYRSNICNPYLSASSLIVDDIIKPSSTRKHIIRTLTALAGKNR